MANEDIIRQRRKYWFDKLFGITCELSSIEDVIGQQQALISLIATKHLAVVAPGMQLDQFNATCNAIEQRIRKALEDGERSYQRN